MKRIDVMAVTLNLTPLDLAGNEQKIRDAFRFVHERELSSPPPRAKCVLFPEFPVCGHIGDAFNMPWFRKRVLEKTLEILPETHGIIAVISLPLEFNGQLYRAAMVAVDGTPLGFVCSKEIPLSLSRWFTPWPSQKRSTISIGGKSYPIGDITFEISGVAIGIAFSPQNISFPSVSPDLVLIPGADPFELRKAAARRESLRSFSEKEKCAVIFANLTGNEGGTILYDGESAITETGVILALERRFSYLDLSCLSAALDLDKIRNERCPGEAPRDTVQFPDTFEWGWHNERRYPHLGFYRESDDENDSLFPEEWERSGDIAFEEFPRAVAAGLYDYLRKTRSLGFVLSLSGGADSAAVAVLVSLMVSFGTAALGVKNFLAKISYIKAVSGLIDLPLDKITQKSIVQSLLTTVYQGTANSSSVTRKAAFAVADSVGSAHHEFDIEDLVEGYRKIGTAAAGRPLDWSTDDLALQNIQARTRGPAAWLLANIKGGLLLATSNRSEAACGYATMDGDTCGSLSPIAGISKDFLRNWLRWLETAGPHISPSLLLEDSLEDMPSQISFPALRLINEQQPTAELRPLETGQTDEADLMPYAVLDIIERGIVENRLFGKDLEDFIQTRLDSLDSFRNADCEQISAWIRKFERMFTQSQWKRYRYAPGFHLENEDLNPDYFRLPSLSAGFPAGGEY